MQKLTDKKIAVVGAGGVGGYMAGMLGRACTHMSVAARGKRREALSEHGIVLHSDHNGEIVSRPERIVTTAELGEQDYIFVCVKNYSLESVCKDLQPAASRDTVIVPVMNGADTGDRIRKFIGKGTVVDSLIYIVTFANEDFSITQQGDFANLRIGIQNADDAQKRKIDEVSDILSAAGIDHEKADDIETEIWRKYILNCAYNVETAFYDNTIGQLRDDPVKAKEYETLVEEAYHVAQAKGVSVTQGHIDRIINRFYKELAYGATSSLQRDVCSGRTSELETFSGYIVREADRLGVPAPLSHRMYEGLKEICEGRRSQV